MKSNIIKHMQMSNNDENQQGNTIKTSSDPLHIHRGLITQFVSNAERSNSK